MQSTNSLDTALPSVSADGVVPFPYDVRFVDCEVSPAVRHLCEEYLARMAHFYDRIDFGRVYLRIPHKHGHNRFFHVHVQLDIPGRRLVASREPEVNDKHMDVRLAIRDAFHSLQRELVDFTKRRNSHKGAKENLTL